MLTLVKTAYNGIPVTFRYDGWFNATEVAKHFDKRPVDWLHRSDTCEYLAALSRHNGKGDFLEQLNIINGLDATSAAAQAKLLKLSKSTGYIKDAGRCPRYRFNNLCILV